MNLLAAEGEITYRATTNGTWFVEHAWIVVVEGSATFRASGETVEAPAGTLMRFEPDERHSVATESGAKLLLLLAPWPGPGHYRGQERAQIVG